MIIGNREFCDEGKVYVMGILNVTPDSFSDGGRYSDVDKALKRTECMINEGADIIDIGAESTRPGYTPVGDEHEIQRLVPVVEAVRRRFDIPISVDTFHPAVAKAAIMAGADMINDIWGLRYCEGDMCKRQSMAEVISEAGVSVCIMHNQEQEAEDIDEINERLSESLDIAHTAGIAKDRIMLDPGVGFAKSYHMNLSVIANLNSFHKHGYPVLLGASRKSVVGLTLELPVEERLEGTLVTSVFAVMGGCSYVRVHDVGSNVRAIKMAEALRMQSHE